MLVFNGTPMMCQESHQKEDGTEDVCPPHDPGYRLCVNRVKGKGQSCEERGQTVPSEYQLPGVEDQEVRCYPMQDYIDEMVWPWPSPAQKAVQPKGQ